VVLIEPGTEIGPSHLPFVHTDGMAAAPDSTYVGALPTYEDEAYHIARDRVIAEFELRYLTALVHRASGNMSKAARLAGVDRTTLYRLMEKHGLQRETIMVEGDRP
jgi:DNA-binding NtrC family response regulator